MPIDVEKALGAELPPSEVVWSEKDVLLYHLAIGAGVPPTDPRELTYAYEKNLQVLPTFGVVASAGRKDGGGPLSMPGIDIDLAMVLHGEQEITVHAPLPVDATASANLKIANIYDKGAAAVIVLEAETRDADDTPLFTTRSSIFVRGEGGFGGDRGPKSQHAAPEREPDTVVESPTLDQQALLYRLCGDRNPLHADPEFAALGGFDRPILHGLCTYGIVCKAVVDACLDGDATRVTRYGARFAGVVFPGETLVTSVWDEGEHLVVQSKTKERGEPVLSNVVLAHT